MKAVHFWCRENAGFKPALSELQGLSPHFHSDTLWSALVHLFSDAYPQATDAFIGASMAGEFKCSSLLPLLVRPDRTFVYLYPKPLSFASLDPLHAKAWKSIRWVSLACLQAETQPDLGYRIGGDILLHPADLPAGFRKKWLGQAPFFQSRDLAKVKVHTLASTNSFYYQSELHLRRRRVGQSWWQPHFHAYYELAPTLSPKLKSKIEAAFRLLVDTGLGGERSTGLGQFEGVSFFDPPWDSDADALQMSLSLVLPQAEMDWLAFQSYDTLIRGGGNFHALTHPDRNRKRLRMLREGGLFRGQVNGSIADISPVDRALDWPIYRNGHCISMPVSSVFLPQSTAS